MKWFTVLLLLAVPSIALCEGATATVKNGDRVYSSGKLIKGWKGWKVAPVKEVKFYNFQQSTDPLASCDSQGRGWVWVKGEKVEDTGPFATKVCEFYRLQWMRPVN